MFYVIPCAVGELSQKELAAASSTISPRILTIPIKEEVYAIAWKLKLNQNKRFQLHEAIGIILDTLLSYHFFL
jgi:hypothetical protein